MKKSGYKMTIIIRKCLYCKKDLKYLPPSAIKKGEGKFCNQSCYKQYQIDTGCHRGKNNPCCKKQERICKTCGNPYLVTQSQIKHRGSNFCSRKCRSDWIKKEKSGRGSWNWIDKIKCKCLICGKDFEKQRCDVKRRFGKYCSRECWAKSREREGNPLWNNGASFEPYCPLWNHKFRERARAFFGNRCVICEKHKDELGYRPCVHHVLYDKQVCCKENEPIGNRLFVTLCRQHHTASNSNREYWKDYFTKLINENYGGRCYYTENEYEQLKQTRNNCAIA